jgi:hypothetical protein
VFERRQRRKAIEANEIAAIFEEERTVGPSQPPIAVIPTSPTTRAIATIATIAIVAIRRPKPKHFSLIDQFLPPPSPGTLHGRRTLNVPNLPTLSLSL